MDDSPCFLDGNSFGNNDNHFIILVDCSQGRRYGDGDGLLFRQIPHLKPLLVTLGRDNPDCSVKWHVSR